MGEKRQDIFAKEGIKVKLYDETGSIVIENPLKRKIYFHHDLTSLFGLPFEENKRFHRLKRGETVINRFTSCNNYLIKCDLLDKNENFFNGNLSTFRGFMPSQGDLSKEWHMHKNKPDAKNIIWKIY